MSTNTPLTITNDTIHKTTEFGTSPVDVIALARTSAVTGANIGPDAFSAAATVAPTLNTNHTTDIRDAFLTCLKTGDKPQNFLYTLSILDALDIAFPQLAALDDVPAGPAQYHREGSALQHTLMVMGEYHTLNPNDVTGLLGAMTHDLGKARTDPDEYPNHYGHAKSGIQPAATLANHLRLQDYKTAMTQAAEHHMRMANLLDMRPSKVIRLVETLNQDNGYGAERLLTLLEADGLGRRPQTTTNTPVFQEQIDIARRVIDEITTETVREDHPDMAAEHIDDQLLNKRTHKFKHYLNNDD